MTTPFQLVAADWTERSTPAVLAARRVPESIHDLRRAAPYYQLSEPLAAAVNVALSVGAPLLLTGEPGTGKSQLAFHLAWFFGLDATQPFQLHVKSTSVARDLLYTFDTVGYFHRSQQRDATLDPRDFRTKQALWHAIDEINAGGPAIVLIDEIDKAPRDFPNDLLHELDQYEFKVNLTKEDVKRDPGTAPPVVVITSNSEKRLPPAFLRRCVFHHIKFDREMVERAVTAWRLARNAPGGEAGGAISATRAAQELDERDLLAITRFMEVREHTRVQKKPAVAELLAWLTALDAAGLDIAALKRPLSQLPLQAALVKDRDDFDGLALAP